MSVTEAERDATPILLGFARVLRHAGVDASSERVQALLSALDSLAATRPATAAAQAPSGTSGVGAADAYWAGRLTLCAQPDDLAVYDACFAAYFGGRTPARGSSRWATRHRQPASLLSAGGPAESDGLDGAHTPAATVASDAEVLRHRDVAALTSAERAEVARLVSLLAPMTAPRWSRRYRPASRGPIDGRRTVRRMLHHLGEPTPPARRRRHPKPRRLVLLLDVSGSMTPYADPLLRLGHAAVRRRPASTEVFTLGTRLTRVTRPLRHRDPDIALREAGGAIPDWHGGTRLGESVQAFLRRWGRHGVARGAVVVVCSDGWERGDPAPLAGQLARLSRIAYRLVWVNPHRGQPTYAPLAGGMAAALPYLDDFVAGHSLASLEHLVEVIARA